MSQKDRIQSVAFFSLLIISSLIVFLMVWPFIGALALACLFAILFYPLYKRILKQTKKESLASLLTILVVVFILIIPLSLIGFKIFNQAVELYNSYVTPGAAAASPLDTITDILQTQLQNFLPGFSVNLTEVRAQALNWVVNNLGKIFSSLFQLGLSLFITIIGLFYLLKNGNRIKRLVHTASPLPEEQNQKILNRLETTINSVVKGSLLVAGIQGVISAIGYAIFGVPQPILWGAITSITALIPGVGTAIILAPAVLYLYVSGQSLMALGLLLWGVLAVGLIDNFLGPTLVGRGLKVNPLLTLISVIGGFNLFGPMGFLIGPLFLSLFVTMFDLYLDLMKSNV